jgi:hypothetical protein
VILFRDPGELPADDLGVLLEVLAAAAEHWTARELPFFAVFIDPAHVLALPELYRRRPA